MELRLPNTIKSFFWFLFPFIMVLISIQNIFNNWELNYYSFNEFEDLGRLLFVLVISACESALIIVFLWWILKSVKKVSKNLNK
ncbi:putative membrane protein [Metabacillus crassostreae]|uniref:hypothetical protein n=1 Tax=Metabacillus crassostreae TaxID=929098 RepID=UPI00195737C1|nr:hypothetical protein [Metabacillus crassostreae]MBM7602626.1 putative membrane protein [Metabacillus crassostreae]